MCFRTRLVAVLMAQELLDLPERFHSLRARLPFPEHDKSLSAHTAMRLGIALHLFAEDLHFFRLRLPNYPSHECHSSPIVRTLAIPSNGNPAVLPRQARRSLVLCTMRSPDISVPLLPNCSTSPPLSLYPESVGRVFLTHGPLDLHPP